jgi:hypothetical protein
MMSLHLPKYSEIQNTPHLTAAGFAPQQIAVTPFSSLFFFSFMSQSVAA